MLNLNFLNQREEKLLSQDFIENNFRNHKGIETYNQDISILRLATTKKGINSENNKS